MMVKIFIGFLCIITFSFLFVQNFKNSFINLVRCVAALSVFSLHTHIFTQVPLDKWFVKATYTPAWGGVWCFMILSGYLAEKSFMDGRYDFSVLGIRRYYMQKIKNIIVPTISFVLLCCILVFPSFIASLPEFFGKFFTFRYIGAPGVDGVGATWYVSTLLCFYLLAPAFAFCVDKIKEKKLILSLFFAVLFAFGMAWRVFAIRHSFDWNKYVYCPFFANIDLFVGGMLLAVFSKKIKTNDALKTISLAVFLMLVFANILVYVKQNYFIYQSVFPSFYLISLGWGILCFSDEKFTNKFKTFPEKITQYFSSRSFEFYLFHSLVLHTIMPLFTEQNKRLLHFEVLFLAFVCTCFLSEGFHQVFSRRKKYE